MQLLQNEILKYVFMEDEEKNGNDEIEIKYSKGFSDRLRSLRNEKKISAREMSIALGQNVNYINLIENGKRLPSLQGFFFICDYLKISPSDFFKTEDFESLKKTNSKKQEASKLSEILNSLSEKQILSIIMMIKAFKN